LVADLEFELSYLLTDLLRVEVRVSRAEFDPSTALLCVEAEANGTNGRVCAEVKACRGLEGVRALRCLSKTLAHGGRPLEQLAEGLRRLLRGEGDAA
jgi:hypothetical protein